MRTTTNPHLDPPGIWPLNGRRMARWPPRSRRLLQQTRKQLVDHLKPYIPRACTHLRGHGGVKGAIRSLLPKLERANYVARFDIASYYESMSHRVGQMVVVFFLLVLLAFLLAVASSSR